MLGGHVIKSWSTNQAVVALSSGEAEYYSLVKGASNALGLQAIMNDMGEQREGPICIRTDASAAIGIASRIGIGKVRHIEVSQLWVQEKVSEGRISVEKVGTNHNLADALTKYVDKDKLEHHIKHAGGDVR